MKKRFIIVAIGMVLIATRLFALEWTTLENCTLIPNNYNDGDSFHVMRDGQEYIFRLYFVDTPETELSLSDRIAEQAEAFDITTEDTVKVGHQATAFTAQQLSTNFTVYTKWHSAQGRSTIHRYYALVRVNGKDLGELLIKNGLARIYGVRVVTPENKDIGTIRARLMDFEHKAQVAKFGAWQYQPEQEAEESELAEAEANLPTMTCPRNVTIYSTAEPRYRLGEIERYTKLHLIQEYPDGWVHVRYDKTNGDHQEAYCLRWDLNLPDMPMAAK